MDKLLKILTVHSVKELFKFKSFFFLIFIIIIADRAIHITIDRNQFGAVFDQLREANAHLDTFLFEALPDLIGNWILDYRIVVVAAGLFLFKQIVSMWPSSDMRRMHRYERKGFGVLGSLIALRWDQILWDAVAVSTICSLAAVSVSAAFFILRFLWHLFPSFFWAGLFGLFPLIVTPILFAAFSYSSKLAVISRGSFCRKLGLFFALFTDRRIFAFSYAFFLIRFLIESVFIGIIPAWLIINIENFWLRITLASLAVTPVYSYLKMASFKFFLSVYRKYSEVYEEYPHYYRQT